MFRGRAYKIVLLYVAVSIFWIIISDKFVEKYFHGMLFFSINTNLLKEVFFVGVTALLLFLVLKIYEKSESKNFNLLRVSEARHRLLVENMIDGVLLTGPDGEVFGANKSAQKIFGMTEDEICKSGRQGLVDQDDVRLRMLLRIREEVGVARGGLRFRRRSGELFEAEVSSSLFQDENGFVRSCLIIRDVSGQVKAESDLQKELVRRRVVMNISNDGIAVFDKDHKVVECNYKFAEMIGYSIDEALGLYTWDFEAIFTEEEVRRSFSNFSEVCCTFESKHRRKDGSVFNVEVSASGAIVGFEPMIVTISRDISDRKKAEQDIRESEERFRNLFDHVDSISVQGYDSSRNVTYWNRASEVLYGYSRDEAIGKKLEELIIPPAVRGEVVEAIRLWIDEGQAIPASELCLMKKDLSNVSVFSSHVLQQNRFGAKELFCLDIDLTELQKTKKELIKLKEIADQANRAKSEFLANMSHEIRTPLNGILGMAQLLETTELDDEQKEYVEASIKSTKKLNVLLSDVLDLSRIEANQLVISKVCFELETLIKSSREVFDLTAREKGLTLSFVVNENVPEYLIGDEVRVRQILFNVVGNAIKFAKAGTISIECFLGYKNTENDINLVFAVSDSGIGIHDDKLGLVFEPFTQVDGSFVREQQGVGLGLSIVKKLTNLLGGSACVDSCVGVGTVFYVCLPFQVCRGFVQRMSVQLAMMLMFSTEISPFLLSKMKN